MENFYNDNPILDFSLENTSESAGTTNSFYGFNFTDEKQFFKLIVSFAQIKVWQSGHNTIINLSPTQRALYILFLRHPDGIMFSEMEIYKEEMQEIYRTVLSKDKLTPKQEDTISKICDMNEPTFYETISRIKSEFYNKLQAKNSESFIIKGDYAARKKIDISRNNVVFERI